jgi:hypothetical protein
VCLGIKATVRDPRTIILSFPRKNIFRHLHFSSYGAPSLMRGRICNLLVQLLLGLNSAVIPTSKSAKLVTICYSLCENLSQSNFPSFAGLMPICQLANQRRAQQRQLPLDRVRLGDNCVVAGSHVSFGTKILWRFLTTRRATGRSIVSRHRVNVFCSVRVSLRLTVCQSVCLGVEPRPGLMTRCLLTL